MLQSGGPPAAGRPPEPPAWSGEPAAGGILTAVRRLGIPSLLLPLALGLAEERPATPGAFAERPAGQAQLVDEDEEFARPERAYAFNPVQAGKELKVGNYYFKKGSYAAAATRYLEATRWDGSSVDAYWRLGLSHERLLNPREAIAAYTRCLALDPAGKRAREARRRIERMEGLRGDLPLAESAARPRSAGQR